MAVKILSVKIAGGISRACLYLNVNVSGTIVHILSWIKAETSTEE